MKSRSKADLNGEDQVPRGKGTYALLMRLDGQSEIELGKLGRARFPSGYYLYFGSALGGLAGRVLRHLRTEKRTRWHIDYLTAEAAPQEVWWVESEGRAECTWAEAGLMLPGAKEPVPGFGSSDCRCRSHLVHFPDRPTVADLRRMVDPAQPRPAHVMYAGNVD